MVLAVTVTITSSDVAVQVVPTVVTVYVPLWVTVMLCVVAPVLQVLPLAAEEASTTEPPSQKFSGPDAVIVGVPDEKRRQVPIAERGPGWSYRPVADPGEHQPGVSTVIPGASRPEQARANAAAADLAPLDAATLAGLEAVYDGSIREHVHARW